MTRVARILVGIFTFAIPVFIAACYGVRGYYKGGKVLDKATRLGISDIDVTCMQAQPRGSLERGGSSRTHDDTGSYLVYNDVACTSLLAEDALKKETADGGTPSGSRTARYTAKLVPFDEAAAQIDIELEAE